MDIQAVTGAEARVDERARIASLEHWAAIRPSATAIADGDVDLSYGDWNKAANALAEAMAAAGLGQGDIVVTRLQIRHEWAIVSAAAAKLGCRLLGLNWRLTASEAKYILENSGADAIFCDDADPSELLAGLQPLVFKLLVSLDRDANGFRNWAELVEGEAPERFSQGEAGLIIYTSGTTGLPKGVQMGSVSPHMTPQNLQEYSAAVAQSRVRHDGDIIFITLPLHHGAGPASVRSALAIGTKMVFMRRFDPEHALSLIERHRVSSWSAVPTMYKRMAALPDEVINRYDLSSLTVLGVGAAPVTPELKQWITDHFGEILHEGYGSTETGMISSIGPAELQVRPRSCGRPHKHVSIDIRDEDGQILGVDAEGEIWVRTPVTISAYINAPPLGDDVLDDRGFFRTGDVGCLDADGFLYITDRLKDMIISGGVNIYPAEIEGAISRHPAVQDVAVIGIPHDEFGEQVMAFVEKKPGHSVDAETLHTFVAPLLASYKRPRDIEFMENLPRNTMGKLLKRELRSPYWKDAERKV